MLDLKKVETKLEDLFKDAPKLSDNSKEALAKYWPYIALIFGVLQIMAAFALLGLMRTADNVINGVNNMSMYYLGESVKYSALDKTWIYFGILLLLAEAVLMVAAYPSLKKRLLKGWQLLFLGSLINVVYSVISLFIRGRGFGSFLMSSIGSIIGFYLLFQIKSKYSAKAAK